MNIRLTSAVLLCLVGLSAATTPLVDSSGSVHGKIPEISTSAGVVGIITSPGTPSPLGGNDDDILSLTDSNQLSCRGATLSSASSAGERLSLCTTSIVAGAIVLEGITEGDLEMGLRHSRHARTLTALFRTKECLLDEDGNGDATPQTLMLGVMGTNIDEEAVAKEVTAIFEAVAVELKGKHSFTDSYNLQVVTLQTAADAQSVRCNSLM